MTALGFAVAPWRDSPYPPHMASRPGDRWAAFRARVREDRRKRGWNQSQLADAAGLSKTALSDIESGQTAEPQWKTAESIAQALGWAAGDLDTIIGGGGAADPEPIPKAAMIVARRVLGDAPEPWLELYARKLLEVDRLSVEIAEIEHRFGVRR